MQKETNEIDVHTDILQIIRVAYIIYSLQLSCLILAAVIQLYIYQATTMYLGYALVFVLATCGLLLSYVKKRKVKQKWLSTHFSWQIRSYWFGLLWALIGLELIFVTLGSLLLINYLWLVYRVSRGIQFLNRQKPLPIVDNG
jgi:uncharacterized membrane protein